MPETTELIEMVLDPFPAGYKLGEISQVDSASDHHTQLQFPIAETDSSLSAVIQQYCEDFAQAHLPTPPHEEFASSSFSMWVVAMQEHPRLLSIQFMEQSFYWGAAHFNHGNPCLNLDVQTQRRVPFTQLFSFSSGHSKTDFCTLANDLNRDAAGEIVPSLLNAELDYFVGVDSLTLCFDDYDLGPSLCQLRLPLDTLRPYWSTRAKHYLSL